MRFSLFGIPIRVKPGFLVLSVAIGLVNVTNPLLAPLRVQLFIGILLATFLGVLIHELGHAVEARRAGANPDVNLTFFGGLTRFQARRSHFRNLWISSAGIVYQLTAAGIVYASYRWGPLPSNDLPAVFQEPDVLLLAVLLQTFVLLNVFFAVINLIPVGGLDGGAIIEHFLRGVKVKYAAAIMFVFYSLVGLGVLIWAITYREWWILAVAVYLTGVALWNQAQAMKRDGDESVFPDAERRGRQLLAAGKDEELLTWSQTIRSTAQSPPYAVFGATWEVAALKRLGLKEQMSSLLDTHAHVLADPVVVMGFEECGRHEDIVARYHTKARTPDADPDMIVTVAKSLIELGRPEEAAELTGFVHLTRLPLPSVVEIHRRLWDHGAHAMAEGFRETVSSRKDAGYGVAIQMLRAEGKTDQTLQRLKREIEDSSGGTALGWLSWVLAEDGRSTESEETMQRAVRRGHIRDGVAIQYALDLSGHYQQAMMLGEWLLEEGELTREERSVVAFNHACGHIYTGDLEAAVATLEQLDVNFLLAVGLADSDLDPIRHLPAFREVYERAEAVANI